MDTKCCKQTTELIFLLLLFALGAEVLKEKKAKPVTSSKGLYCVFFIYSFIFNQVSDLQ